MKLKKNYYKKKEIISVLKDILINIKWRMQGFKLSSNKLKYRKTTLDSLLIQTSHILSCNLVWFNKAIGKLALYLFLWSVTTIAKHE